MDKDDICCAATSGLGVQKYGVETGSLAALHSEEDLAVLKTTPKIVDWFDGELDRLRVKYLLERV